MNWEKRIWRVHLLWLVVLACLVVLDSCCQVSNATADDTAVINASLRVDIPGAGGSGVAIAPHLVVTNSHVVDHKLRNDVTVTDVHGRKYRAIAVSLDQSADVALLYVQHRAGPYVRIAPRRRPLVGLTLRLFGWGPTRRLAKGTGVVVAEWQRNRVQVLDCAVHSEPGDSGGGLFDEQDQLVALNWGGDRDTNYSASTPAEYVRQVAETWVTHAFPEDRWQEYQCLGGRCGGGPSETAGSARGVAPPKWPVAPPPMPPLDYHPPAASAPPVAQSPLPPPPMPPAAPVVPVAPKAPQPSSPAVDADQLVSAIVAKLAADDRFRGPPGPAGPAGADGRNGKDGEPGKAGPKGEDAIVSRPLIEKIVAEQLAKQMPDIVAKSVEQVRGSVRVRVQPVKQ